MRESTFGCYEKVYVQFCTLANSCSNKSSSKLLSRVKVESSLFGDFLYKKVKIAVAIKNRGLHDN